MKIHKTKNGMKTETQQCRTSCIISVSNMSVFRLMHIYISKNREI